MKSGKKFKLGQKVWIVWFNDDSGKWKSEQHQIIGVLATKLGTEYYIYEPVGEAAYSAGALYSTKREADKVAKLKNDLENIWQESVEVLK
jgi:hypothetical protein